MEILTALIAALASLVVAVIAAIFTYFSTRSNQRDLERLKASLGKLERLEEDRNAGYAKVWKLTVSLNLFGSKKAIKLKKLSDDLMNWYFKHGWVLSRDSKNRYFLIQEVLHFIKLRKVTVGRPEDERLYESSERPIEQLKEFRKTTLGVEILRENSTYQILKLEKYVSDWKTDINKNGAIGKSESAWLLLQLLLSSFRSGIVRELKSSDSYRK